MQTENNQKAYFVRYLSLIPVISVLLISLACSLWAIFNRFFPDLLFHPIP